MKDLYLMKKLLKNLMKFFYSIRDIKVYFLQSYYLNNFVKILNKYAVVIKKFLTLQILPRLGIELVLIFVFSIF